MKFLNNDRLLITFYEESDILLSEECHDQFNEIFAPQTIAGLLVQMPGVRTPFETVKIKRKIRRKKRFYMKA